MMKIVVIICLIVGVVEASEGTITEGQLMKHVMDPYRTELLHSFANTPPGYWPSNDPNDVYFFLYNNPKAFNQFHTIHWNNPTAVRELPWIVDAPVKILIHGFTQSQNTSMPAMVKDAYLERMWSNNNQSVNIVVVDWGRLCGSMKAKGLPIYTNAVQNVEAAGRRVGELIVNLKEYRIVTLDNVHVIGFSLGAHVSGWAGAWVRRNLSESIGRITGLDPAGPLFYANIPNFNARNLGTEDAKYVDTIHTSWGTFGIAKKIGHANFYPNFGLLPLQTQPYCVMNLQNLNLLPPQTCSHNMAPVFFAMSILTNLDACKCENYGQYEISCRTVCYEPATCGEYWEYWDPTKTGDFYLDIPRRLHENSRRNDEPGDRLVLEDSATRPFMLQLDPTQMSRRESGRMVGIELIPTNQVQVEFLNNLRNSPSGYLFWGGKITVNEAVTILVPLDLKNKLLSQIMESSSISNHIFNYKIRYDPVIMEIKDRNSGQGILKSINAELLMELSANYSAPFTQNALDRIQGGIYGSSRPPRSTDVAIYNSLGKTFTLKQYQNCETGVWTSSLRPEGIIGGHSAVVYRVESRGFLTGVTNCNLHYEAMDGSGSFKVYTSNPYAGSNYANATSQGVKVSTIVGKGNNNLVRFVIY